MTTQRVVYPVSLNLRRRSCVVIGAADDREAVEKSAELTQAGADVRRVYGAAALRDDDLRDVFFVISTPQDDALSERLRRLADEYRFLLCCIDQPKYGSVALASIVKAGPLRVAISTAGRAPRVAKLLKEALQRAMNATFARFIEEVAARREAVKAARPSPAELPIRREEAIETAAGFTANIEFVYPQWFDTNA